MDQKSRCYIHVGIAIRKLAHHTRKCKRTGAGCNEMVQSKLRTGVRLNGGKGKFFFFYLFLLPLPYKLVFYMYLSCHLAQRAAEALQCMIINYFMG